MAESCSGNHKQRLFIGEGNFSFTEAFIDKHDKKFTHPPDRSLAFSIVATEYAAAIHCNECDIINVTNMFAELDSESSDSQKKEEEHCDDCLKTLARIENLKKQGVNVILDVDARKLSTNSQLQGKRFPRIHWNCPHDKSSFRSQTLPLIIEEFFLECRKMQGPNDRVHVALAQPQDGTKKYFYQGYVYDITKAARKSGYVLIKKRKFTKQRYPGYVHVQTNSNEKAKVTDEGVREFIFKQLDSKIFKEIRDTCRDKKEGGVFVEPLLENLAKASEKNQSIKSGQFYDEDRFYYVCSSDSDSSGCDSK